MWRYAEAFVASKRRASDNLAALTEAGLLTRGATGHETHYVLPSAGNVRNHKLPIPFIPSAIIPVSFHLGHTGEKIIPSGVSLYIGTPE